MRSVAVRGVLVCALAGFLLGCGEEAPPPPQSVRPIRSFTITEASGGQVRRFSGIIEAIDSSNLSFEVPGNVLRVQVNQGDSVRRGQVLAVLDDEPYRLNVQAADAELQRARAFLAQARADYDRNTRLLGQRAVARVQFEVSQREFQAAQSQVDFTIAKLNLAQRDLRNTTLAAPFDGTISARLVDPHTQVQGGQTVFRVDDRGGMQAAVGVPETSIGQLSIGMAALVSLPQGGIPIKARISEIGTAAGAGNVFPVKAALVTPPPNLRAGMTAEVTLVLGDTPGASSHLIPLSAIAPGDASGEGFVFVFDSATSTVQKTHVRAAGSLADNMVAVTGLSVGDTVATAGVNFLVDGQQVKLLNADTAAARS